MINKKSIEKYIKKLFGRKALSVDRRKLGSGVQGAGFLIEYDNTSEEADHIHLVWREFAGDFGRDVLAEHRRTHH